MRFRELIEGGWETKITQGTVINPSIVRTAMQMMNQFVQDFNAFLSKKNVGQIKLGHPLGSTAYYDVDPDDKIYGDIDLQIIVPEIDGMSPSQMQAFWYKLQDEFVKSSKPNYVHHDSEPGHPILKVSKDAYVQVDLIPHPERLSTWGRFRTTPERGVKGLLNGNMFSALGEMLRLSIQHAGVQYKERNGVKQPYVTTRKDYELKTLTTNIETFVRDIFNHEYEQIIGGDISNARIDPLLSKHPGSDINNVKIANLVNAVKGLARSFELNGMFGKGDLAAYSSASDFLAKFLSIYEDKALKDIANAKRDKADTPQAKARAEEDRQKVQQGLEMVKGLFAQG